MTDNKDTEPEDIRAKILHLLSVYPIISPTMLQSGLGPYVKAIVWRPILQELIDNDEVLESTENRLLPSGRHNTYTKLMLPVITVEQAHE